MKFDSAEFKPVDHAINVGLYKFEIKSLKNNDLGNYTLESATGITSNECEITAKSIANVVITVDSAPSIYSGEEQSPNIASVLDKDLDDDKQELVLGTDYFVSDASKLTNVAEAPVSIIIEGQGNYTGKCTSTKWNLTPITATLSWADPDYTYGGTAHMLTATLSGAVGTDVLEIVSYTYKTTGTNVATDAINAGAVTVTATGGIKISGQPNPTLNYKLPEGTASSKNYQIKPKNLDELDTDFGFEQKTTLTYDGTTKQAFGAGNNQGNMVCTDKRATVNKGLIYGTDFVATDSTTTSAITAGTRQITLSGQGNYSGTTTIQ